jgi:hypothetical protein
MKLKGLEKKVKIYLRAPILLKTYLEIELTHSLAPFPTRKAVHLPTAFLFYWSTIFPIG